MSPFKLTVFSQCPTPPWVLMADKSEPPKLNAGAITDLLNQIGVTYGICLSGDAESRLLHDFSTDPEKFTQALFAAYGWNWIERLDLYRQVRKTVRTFFGRFPRSRDL